MRRPSRAAAFPLLAMLLPILAGCGGADEAARPVAMRTEEILTNPTARSVQLAFVPGEDVERYAIFGEQTGGTRRTETALVRAGELSVQSLDGLEPGARHRAQILLRRPGEERFVARPAVHFRTLRAGADARVRFAYAADSHIVGRQIRTACDPTPSSSARLTHFRSTLEAIVEGDPDFLIAGGDNFMTHAPRLASCEAYAALGSGTVRTPEQADLRYELGLSPGLWGRVARQLPFLYVLGNHDGEARFGDPAGSYGHFGDTRSLSRGARLRHLPDPTAVYEGSDDGDLYFTFASGPARFVVLDVMAGPRALPRRVEDWTLGVAQKAWLERVLEANRSPWVFVFAEHLVGGVRSPDDRPLPYEDGPPGEYHYGRGGLRATGDRTPRGRFLGEQAELQALMSRTGVDVFFHAHDHVAVVGEKRAADGRGEGVYYAMAGQASGESRGPKWASEPWFEEEMDYDGDGEPDYRSGKNGTARAGFYRVTVEGTERALLEFVTSDGEPAFRITLFADGSSDPPL